MSLQQLERARAMELPSRADMLQRAPSVQQFWYKNRNLFPEAWQAWENSRESGPYVLDEKLFDPTLRAAVMQAWKDPAKEQAVRDLWTEIAPGVYEAQLFDLDRLADFRAYLEDVWNAQIPLRPPYGIVLNRGGAMLDRRSEGYLAAPGFQAVYQEILDRYMRPVSRMLYPETFGYDTQTFGFSIRYQAGKDTNIRPHTDASSVTLNINLNLPDEKFTGSAVNFYDQASGDVKALTFKPGTAVIHRGNVPHAAQPILSGERTNLVLWLYGNNGQMPPQGATGSQIDARERWSLPSVTPDNYAPF